MNRKVFDIRISKDFLAHAIVSDEFDNMLDAGYDDILIITPRGRYIASLDEWLDYSYIDLDGDVEVRVMHRSYMGLA